jgi:hypothetical protein
LHWYRPAQQAPSTKHIPRSVTAVPRKPAEVYVKWKGKGWQQAGGQAGGRAGRRAGCWRRPAPRRSTQSSCPATAVPLPRRTHLWCARTKGTSGRQHSTARAPSSPCAGLQAGRCTGDTPQGSARRQAGRQAGAGHRRGSSNQHQRQVPVTPKPSARANHANLRQRVADPQLQLQPWMAHPVVVQVDQLPVLAAVGEAALAAAVVDIHEVACSTAQHGAAQWGRAAGEQGGRRAAQ